MHILLKKKDLESPSKFKKKLSKYIQDQTKTIKEKYGISFSVEEFGDLLLSACRSREFGIISSEVNDKILLDEEKVSRWIEEKLIPNTVTLRLDDEDIIRLLIFSFELAYQMFEGGTRATITEKGFRERKRAFETIVVNQFIGRLGEVMVKKFLENTFPGIKVELDWEISRQIKKHKRSDIINAKKNVSIKTTSALAGVWAEADKGYDYGIMVKCSIPEPVILRLFIEICGFSSLLDFAERKIPPHDNLFKEYLANIRKRVKSYKCGEIQTDLKGIICGYFKTSKELLRYKGDQLPYMGKVKEERYMIQMSELKWTKDDWKKFLEDVGLLKTD